jgi:fructose-1,6-bisphosphatase/inositol monophosphatase family enzyme
VLTEANIAIGNFVVGRIRAAYPGYNVIVEEAGGLWTDLYGSSIDYTIPLLKVSQNFTNCVVSPALHEQLVAITDKYKIGL